MQNILFFSSLSTAYIIPKVILTGSPGGTVMVIRSKNFLTKSLTEAYCWIRIISTIYVETDNTSKNARYLEDSF